MLIRAERLSEATLFKPILVLLIALAAATFAAVFMKLALENGLPAPVVAAGRLGVAALLLTPLVLRDYRDELQRLTRRDWLFAAFAGFWIAVHFFFLASALELISIMLLTVFANTSPIWVALLETTFLRARLGRIVWTGLFITVLGGIVTALASGGGSAGDSPLLGIVITLVASIAGATYMTIGRSVRRKISLVPYVWIVFGCGSLIGFVFVWLSGTPVVGHPGESYFWLLMIALVPQLIGHSGFNFALAYFSATIISLSTQILSVTAAVTAFFIFAELPGWGDVLGSLIVVTGVVLAIMGRRRQSVPHEG